MNNEENNKTTNGGNSGPKKPSIIERYRHSHLLTDDAQTTRAMKITGLMLLAILCLFTFVKTINEVKTYNTIGEPYPNQNQITVNGHAEVAVKRDTSKLSFSSQGEGKTASDAQTKAAEANNKAIAFLKSKGVPEADITTQSFNTYPKYDQKVKPCVISTPDAPVSARASSDSEHPTGANFAAGMTASAPAAKPAVAPIAPCNSYESVISGYQTTQTIDIIIRGVDKNPSLTSEIIDGLGVAGVQVGSLQIGIDDTKELKNQARLEAIVNARMEAQKVAKSLGVRLGKVTSYYDNNMYGDPAMEMDMRASAAYAPGAKTVAPMVPTGETKIEADVSVTFEIR